MGDSIDAPSRAERRAFLFDVDATDHEHGAAWLATDHRVLEWHAVDGRLVFGTITPRASRRHPSRHLLDISRERTLELWDMLAEGRLDELERQPWLPGDGWRRDPELDAKIAGAEHEGARIFYASLGPERADTKCRREDCARGAVRFSVFCRPHHFESVRGKRCPFDD
ncbi:MAG: hypothetical protein JWO86_6851 [Myxococcaceae bacterium]|nr:hypothetical protein [Myxococcaceae bacterium]